MTETKKKKLAVNNVCARIEDQIREKFLALCAVQQISYADFDFIGIDNGVTGNVGLVRSKAIGGPRPYGAACNLPTYQYLFSGHRKTRFINTKQLMGDFFAREKRKLYSFILVEQPLTNPSMWEATLSGHRALGQILTLLDVVWSKRPFIVPPKIWQRTHRIHDVHTLAARFSEDSLIGTKLAPSVKSYDGLCLALWCHDFCKYIYHHEVKEIPIE